MGMLILTKGTQFFATFLNGRFNSTNLPTLRTMGSVVTDFQGSQLPSSLGFTSLLTICENHWGGWADGGDVFYPTATVTTVQAANNTTTLTFSGALPTWVTTANPTAALWDQTTPAAIPTGTTILTVNSSTNITLSNPVTHVGANDTIVFSDPRHPNLIKRWKYYLRSELSSTSHAKIQNAIAQALLTTSYTSVNFQTIEDTAQKVVVSTEFGLRGNGNIDQNNKILNIVLLTPATQSSVPIDSQ
jgi:hypothetical protein